jgi:hypothetical protein
MVFWDRWQVLCCFLEFLHITRFASSFGVRRTPCCVLTSLGRKQQRYPIGTPTAAGLRCVHTSRETGWHRHRVAYPSTIIVRRIVVIIINNASVPGRHPCDRVRRDRSACPVKTTQYRSKSGRPFSNKDLGKAPRHRSLSTHHASCFLLFTSRPVPHPSACVGPRPSVPLTVLHA